MRVSSEVIDAKKRHHLSGDLCDCAVDEASNEACELIDAKKRRHLISGDLCDCAVDEATHSICMGR